MKIRLDCFQNEIVIEIICAAFHSIALTKIIMSSVEVTWMVSWVHKLHEYSNRPKYFKLTCFLSVKLVKEDIIYYYYLMIGLFMYLGVIVADKLEVEQQKIKRSNKIKPAKEIRWYRFTLQLWLIISVCGSGPVIPLLLVKMQKNQLYSSSQNSVLFNY